MVYLSAFDESHSATVVYAVDQQIIAFKEVDDGLVQLLDELVAQQPGGQAARVVVVIVILM
ncbi:MAG: hypothetical protein WBW48_07605 [Anaerolineae bacterium]